MVGAAMSFRPSAFSKCSPCVAPPTAPPECFDHMLLTASHAAAPVLALLHLFRGHRRELGLPHGRDLPASLGNFGADETRDFRV